MKIAVLNDVHIGTPLAFQGAVRASSHLVEDILPGLISRIIQQHTPDVIVNLGDLIRASERNADLRSYQRALGYFRQANCPVIHTLGNHELKCMSLQDVEDAWGQQGFHQKSYGQRDLGHCMLIWLGMEANTDNYKLRRLPETQVNWLKNALDCISKPVLLFTHCAIDSHNVTGNYFFETFEKSSDTSSFFLENQEAIRNIISKNGNVTAVLQGHLHYFHANTIDGIPYITCPAMGDNICGPSISENIPEIYSIISFDGHELTVKGYSREYCFAGFEKADK